MVGGINSLMGNYPQSALSSVSPVFDYASAQKQTQSLVNQYKTNNQTASKLKGESADFLNRYTVAMKSTAEAAGKLTNGGIDKLLRDKEGNVTEDTIKQTVNTVQKMVDEHNATLKTLNNNADRGEGVMKQMARMVDDPAPQAAMKLVGVSVNKDGTLALDTKKMTEALQTTNEGQLKLFSDIIGGSTGIASGVQKDAQAGLRASARSLIENDLAQIQSIRAEDPVRMMSTYTRAGAFALNNQAAIGLLMNFAV